MSDGVAAQNITGVQAKSYIALDDRGNVLVEKDASTQRPIASISKLIVAEQVYPTMQPDRVVKVKPSDLVGQPRGRVKANMHFTEQQLLELSLISSDNHATYALARTHNAKDVIDNVNSVAKSRGLDSITLEEPSGLSANNKASAFDLATFLMHLRHHPVTSVSVEPTTSFGNFRSTNPLIGKPGWDFVISKTGFIRAAGGCLVTTIKIRGRDTFIVLLGSGDTKTRWADLIKIRQFIDSDAFWTGKEQTSVRRTKRK